MTDHPEPDEWTLYEGATTGATFPNLTWGGVTDAGGRTIAHWDGNVQRNICAALVAAHNGWVGAKP